MAGIEMIESVSKCDKGIKRPYQEDSVRMSYFSHCYDGSVGKMQRTGWLLAVADGIGGHSAGDVASRIALNAFFSRTMEFSADLSVNSEEEIIKALKSAYSNANAQVYQEGGNGSRKMGTTLVVAYVIGEDLYIGNVGDSRCYLMFKGKIVRATKDDSYTQQLIDTGNIRVKEADTHPRKNEITNAIGIFPSDSFAPSVTHFGSVMEYEHILLCTDGLHGVVKDQEMTDIINKRESNTDIMAIADELLNLALQRGAPDNTTLIFAKVHKGA